MSRHAVRFEINAVPPEDSKQVLRFASGLNGLMLTGMVTPGLLQALDPLHIPICLIGHMAHDPAEAMPMQNGSAVAIVGWDETAMGRLATARLLTIGHHRVAFICETIVPGLSHARWLSGYRLAHLDRDRVPDPALVQVAGAPRAGAEQAIERLFDLPEPPTAFVIPDIRISDSAIHALQTRGVNLDPDQVVIGGLDEVAARYGVEAFARITPDLQRIVEVAAQHLNTMMDDPAHAAPLELLVPARSIRLPGLD